MAWLDPTKLIYATFVVLQIAHLGNSEKQHKRQIYREQVLPALGGKIPEEAFRTDRLALNRLNKDGITVIDGVLLEAREHDKNPDNVRSKPEVIQVYVTQDSRYVPPEGRYHNDRPKSVDTTYVIRKPVGNNEDEIGRTKLNGSPVSTLHHNDRPLKILNGGHINSNDNISGYRRTEVSSAGSKPLQNLPKAHGYANFHRYVPAISNNQLSQHQQQQYYQTIYKPIVTPLVIPAREITFTKPNNNNYNKQYESPRSWDLTYDWHRLYQPQPIFFEDTSDLFFDPHQIITDYEGFFNSFHGRSYRHVGTSNKKIGSDKIFFKESKDEASTNFHNEKLNRQTPSSLPHAKSLSTYTELTSIPETNFSCAGRKGTFVDVQTKCQVFHECSGWSKTSSLCPAGTAYSSRKKRCEWWNTVHCGSE